MISRLKTEFAEKTFLICGRFLGFDLVGKTVGPSSKGYKISGKDLAKLLETATEKQLSVLFFDGEKIKREVAGLRFPLCEAYLINGEKADVSFNELIDGRKIDNVENEIKPLAENEVLLHFFDVRLRNGDFKIKTEELVFEKLKKSYKRKLGNKYQQVFFSQVDSVGCTKALVSKGVTDDESKLDELIESAKKKLILQEKKNEKA